jgi:hypothetical protein
MRADPGLRELVVLSRAANDGDADALSILHARSPFNFSRAPLDRDDAIRELLDPKAHVSPELRYALARWIAGRITLKRGRRPGKTPTAPPAPGLAPLDAALCIRVLLDFGSTTQPLGVHPNTRRALADLLTGARKLKRGPRVAPPEALRTLLAAHNARLYVTQGSMGRPAMRRAAAEAGIKYGTLHRWLYPRTK